MIMFKNNWIAKYSYKRNMLVLLLLFILTIPTVGYSAITFTPTSNTSLSESGLRDIIKKDFNNDGNTDVITSQYLGGLSNSPPVIEILFGDGNGGILDVTKLVTNLTGGLDFLIDGIDVGLVDADNVLDLAVTAGSTINSPTIARRTYIYKGILNGNKYEFSNAATPVAFKLATLVTPTAAHDVVIGQFNNDSNIDAIVLHENGLSLFLGPLTGMMSTPVEILTSRVTGKIFTAQMNGSDTFLDLITDSAIFFNNNDNTFTRSSSGIGLGLLGTTTAAVTTGNFNGDSNLDIAFTVNYSATNTGQLPGAQLVLMIASGTGKNITYNKILSPIIPNTVFSGLAAGDLDSPRDNIDELVVLDYNADSLQIYSNLNNTIVSNPVSIVISPPVPLNPKLIVLSDMNGDSRLDVVTANDGDLAKQRQSLSIYTQSGTTSESINFFPKNYFTSVPSQTTPLLITVQRNFSSNIEVSVEYTVLDGTATDKSAAQNGIDFNAAVGTQRLTFLANETEKTISIDILATNNFTNKTFSIQLKDISEPGQAILVPLNETALITIRGKAVDLPVISFLNPSYIRPEDSTAVVLEPIIITRTLPQSFIDSGQTLSTVTVKSQIIVGPQVASLNDFTAIDKIYTFNNLETRLNVNVIINNDTEVEGSEDFNLVLSNPVNGTLTANNFTIITIADNDTKPLVNEIPVAVADIYDVIFNPNVSLNIATPGVLNNDKDKETSNINLTARLANATPITGLSFATDGSFSYQPQSVGTIMFQYIVNDGTDDSLPATVTINVKSSEQIKFGTFSFDTANTYNIAENIGQLMLNVNRDTGKGAVDLNYSVISNSAISGNDFIDRSSTPGVLSFGNADLKKTIIIDIVSDTVSEPKEDFSVSLDSVTDGLIANANRSKVITIIGSAGVFSFDPNNIYTVSEQAGVLSLNVIRTLGTTGMVTLNYVIESGSAVAGSDFNDNTNTAGTLTFGPQVNNMAIQIAIVSDSVSEKNEQFLITLKTPSTGLLSDTNFSQTITITETAGGAGIDTSSSSNSGGCVLRKNSPFDPILLLLILVFTFMLLVDSTLFESNI